MAADTGKRVLKSDVIDVLRSDFVRLYHPVREYIEALPAWDGKDRVKELCSHVRPTPSPSRTGGKLNMTQDGIAVEEVSGHPSRSGGARGGFEWALHTKNQSGDG